MDLNTYNQKLNSIRQKYRSMSDVELAQLANQHNIPHALVTEYSDYMFLREKVTARLTMMELDAQME